MKSFILMTFLLPCVLFSQDTTTLDPQVMISGNIYYNGVYHGGVQISEESIVPAPLANAMFYLVRYRGPDLIPEPVQSFSTGKDGSFALRVSPGQYGFVTFSELDSLKPGQYLPAGHETDRMNLESVTYTSWETNFPFPINVSNGPVENISVTNWVRTYCYICP